MDICLGYAGKGCDVNSYPFEGRVGGLTFFGQLLEGNFRKVRLCIGMFNGHTHKLAIFIKVNQDVFIDIFISATS